MARYIDCENCYHGKVCAERHIYHDMIVSCPHHIPKADVVEVVRCKDCKHYKPYSKPVEDFDGECIVRECETDENEFCSYGTPKERGEDNAQ